MRTAKAKKPQPPDVAATEQAKIEAFLAYHQKNFDRNIAAYQGSQAYKTSEMLHGQVDYWKSAVAMLKWLRTINAQRRPTTHGKKAKAADGV